VALARHCQGSWMERHPSLSLSLSLTLGLSLSLGLGLACV
jgi:hypothetical protein